MDKVGNRTTVTETLLQPGMGPVEAFLEESGLLVMEVENGQPSADSNTAWVSQTVQTGYADSAYLRALPDVGGLLRPRPRAALRSISRWR